jgi:protein-disulfide isomerase
VLEKYPEEVKLVFKNYPLSMHSFARSAALASLAAHAQGKFWEFHEKLFANYNSLNDAKLQEFATQVHLDRGKFDHDMASASLRQIVDRDSSEGRNLGIRGIPTVYVNGKPIEDRNPRGFQHMIDAELRKKRN